MRASRNNGQTDGEPALVTEELRAIETAWTALSGLDQAGQRRAMRWLHSKLIQPVTDPNAGSHLQIGGDI